MAKRPNIVFIITDQQRYDTIAALGFDHMITPNPVSYTHLTLPTIYSV